MIMVAAVVKRSNPNNSGVRENEVMRGVSKMLHGRVHALRVITHR
jgi:hypothetical protein